jgi:DnaK suppressor protein
MSDATQASPLNAIREENRIRLLESQAEWNRRLSAIGADRRHAKVPLDPDFEEQAVQRENDPTLDALDGRGRDALAAIRSALSRIEAGNYGWCVACGAPIAVERLRAEPTAERCVDCAR